jgi:hypothetical protein
MDMSTHQPFEQSVEGWTSGIPDDWPNTVTVSTVTGYDAQETDPTAAEQVDGEPYADTAGNRELVQIDTNYKPTRTGQHPVRLTRVDAIQLATHILAATEDTSHYARCGQLRATEAAEVLRALEELDFALTDLRTHALGDLLHETAVGD